MAVIDNLIGYWAMNEASGNALDSHSNSLTLASSVPGGIVNPDIASGGYVPMAAGGMGVVTKPTLFLAGEAGPEQFAFSGSGKRFGPESHHIVQAIDRLARRLDRQSALIQLTARDAAMKAIA